jgi:TonB family protein
MDPVTELSTEPELHLLKEWGPGRPGERWREAAGLSVAAHLALVILLLSLPRGVFQSERKLITRTQVTPLVAPPFELTQPDPNRGKVSKSVNVESLLPRPRIQTPRAAPSTTRPAARTSSPAPFTAPPDPTPAPAPAPPQLAPAPQIPIAPNPTEALAKAVPTPAPPPPQIQTEEKPALVFEDPRSPSYTPGRPTGRIPIPSGSVDEAIRASARGGSGGVTVGDMGVGAGGLGPGLNLPPSPGRIGSNLELLSDPQGVDFRPYMLQVLAAVRRNWFAIMPESAKLGSRGKVALQFSIDRSGRVPKLVIVSPSGVTALDRAAVAGVSASNPFPPLPAEFRGAQIRLQLTFAYNLPTQQ